MNKRIIIVCLILASVLAGCKNRGKKPSEATGSVAVSREFPTVRIPGVITEPLDRINYMAEHLWDKFLDSSNELLTDSTHLYGVEKSMVEEQMGIYATLLESTSLDQAKSYMSSFFDRVAEKDKSDTSSVLLPYISELVAKYFYDPNSPVRNEDIYLPYIQKLSSSELIPESMRPAYAYDASMCALNMAGTKAADFAFTTLEGKKFTLWGIESEYTLLFFSNPGCPACKEIIDVLTTNSKITDLLKGGILAVVNIYIDQELDEWREYADMYPKDWYNGYDHKYTIRTDQIYNVRAIPSLYLLDRDKKVIMKDATPENVFSWLGNLEIYTGSY